MKNIFIIIILLCLSACHEESDREKKEQQIIEQADQADVNKNVESVAKLESVTASQNSDTLVMQNNNLQSQSNNTSSGEHTNSDLTKAEVSFNVCENDIVLGNKESDIVMIEYFSPTCPHCAYYHSIIFPQIKQKYIDTNKIAYVIREFIATKQDLDAAILERCKGDVQSFVKFQNVILEQQDKWAYSNKYRELLTNIGQLGGLSPEDYKQCLDNDKITEILIANTNFVAKTPKFVGTPSFFVNGVMVEHGYTINNISAAIDNLLKKDEIKN